MKVSLLGLLALMFVAGCTPFSGTVKVAIDAPSKSNGCTLTTTSLASKPDILTLEKPSGTSDKGATISGCKVGDKEKVGVTYTLTSTAESAPQDYPDLWFAAYRADELRVVSDRKECKQNAKSAIDCKIAPDDKRVVLIVKNEGESPAALGYGYVFNAYGDKPVIRTDDKFPGTIEMKQDGGARVFRVSTDVSKLP